MKNTLELQLVLQIKKSHKLLLKKQYTQCAGSLKASLETYAQNKSYNTTVFQQFEPLLHSLLGLAYLQNQQYVQAEKHFDHSLITNPLDSATLMRRTQLYLQTDRLADAISDVETGLLVNPRCLNFAQILGQIQAKLEGLKDVDEKKRLKDKIKRVQEGEEEEDETEEEDLIEFSSLKQIDRLLVSPGKLERKISAISFREDSVFSYDQGNPFQCPTNEEYMEFFPITVLTEEEIVAKLEKQDEQLSLIVNQEEKQAQVQKIAIKAKAEGFRKTVLKKQSIIYESSSNISNICDKYAQKDLISSKISALSIKNIDGKMLKASQESIKFQLDSDNGLFHSCESIKLRKSCLRPSNWESQIQIQEDNNLGSPYFHRIRKIDRVSSMYQKFQNEDPEQPGSGSKVSIDSNDHDIYGQDKKQGQGQSQTQKLPVMQLNLPQMPSVSKKRSSILKKESIIEGSPFIEKKKSVCFK